MNPSRTQMQNLDNSPDMVRYRRFMALRPGAAIFIRTQHAIYRRIVLDYPSMKREGYFVNTTYGSSNTNVLTLLSDEVILSAAELPAVDREFFEKLPSIGRG